MAVNQSRKVIIPPVSHEEAVAAAQAGRDTNKIHYYPEHAYALCEALRLPLPGPDQVVVPGAHLLNLISGKFVELLGDGVMSVQIGGVSGNGLTNNPVYLSFKRPVFTGQPMELEVLLTSLLGIPRRYLSVFNLALYVGGEEVVRTVARIVKVHYRPPAEVKELPFKDPTDSWYN